MSNSFIAYGAKLPSYQNFLQLSLIAEILLETSPEREPNDDLFRLLLSSFASL